MSQPPVRRESPRSAKSQVAAHPAAAAIIVILLILAIVGTLYVPAYARVTPKVGDFPFFYFYLLIFMPAVSIALLIVIALQKRLSPPGADDGAPPGPAGPASEVTK
jgi:TRAP-type C4-dicarboxylate transport system permease small subunit